MGRGDERLALLLTIASPRPSRGADKHAIEPVPYCTRSLKTHTAGARTGKKYMSGAGKGGVERENRENMVRADMA